MLDSIMNKDPHKLVESATKVFDDVRKKLSDAEILASETISKNTTLIEEKTKENETMNVLLGRISQQKAKLEEFLGI